jgi:DNA-binding NarL/FixJ family response regulator
VVEDEALLRELMASVVGSEFESEHVVEAGDGESAWGLFQSTSFDFAVLDLMLPRLDGLSLARRMLQLKPDVRILILSSECDDYTIREVTRSGVLGFVDKKEMSLEVLFAAFNEVSAGHVYYSANAQKLIAKMWEDPHAYYKLLSVREFDIVRFIAQGHDIKASAQALQVSESTVRRHKNNAMRKLNIRDEASLVRYALETGFVKFKGGLGWTEVSHQMHSEQANQ